MVAGGPPLEIITATGIGRGLGDPVPTVIFRRVAACSVLVWAISLDGRLQEITAKEEGDEVVVAIRDAGGTRRVLWWNLSPDSPGLKVE